MYLPWTHDEKRSMVEAYRRMHLARCPNDRALLTVTDARTGQTPTEGEPVVLHITCPTCHRRFVSDDIEPDHGPSTH